MKRPKIANVKNIRAMLDAYDMVESAERGDERIVLLHGATGTGKSTALAHLLNETNGIYVEASPAWTLSSMYRDIVAAIGIEPKGRNADLERCITDEMSKKGRPLLIDEIDYLFLPGASTALRMLEVVHSLHDKAGMPVVMVGMDKIEGKIRSREQLSRRVHQWVQFNDLDREDVRIVANALCNIPINDDWLDALIEKTSGRMSYIAQNIKKARNRAQVKGWSEINLAVWGGSIFQVSQ